MKINNLTNLNNIVILNRLQPKRGKNERYS